MIQKIKAKVPQQAQYYCSNSLLFHGMKEETAEYIDSVIINIVKEEMHIKNLPNDLDCLHCIGKSKTKKKD